MGTYRFVFELFLKNKLHPYFKTDLKNKLSGEHLPKINIPALPSIGYRPYIITDVSNYLNTELIAFDNSIKHRNVLQYKGFLVNLIGYSSVSDYMDTFLSKRNRKNLRSKQKRLESDCKISYEFNFGNISQTKYDFLFDAFYRLLKNRFDEKKTYNRNLLKWKELYKLVRPMVLDKKASLFVMYDGTEPICITLNFHLRDIVFSHIQTYDIKYSKYTLGDISMVKHLEFCLQNNVSVFDLSMGETPYKVKWCNHTYNFIYHVFYNSKSFISYLLMLAIVSKLRLKQFLRDKNILGKIFEYDKFTYSRKNKLLENHEWRNTL